MTPLSEDHKAALAEGRARAHAVRRYLDALRFAADGTDGDDHSGLRRELDEARAGVEGAVDVLERLALTQRRIDLETALARQASAADLADLERAFVDVAAEYGRRKGITRAGWVALGVPEEVLARAGIEPAP